MNTGGWQTQVYDQPSAAVAGDRASNNPLASYNAGPGGLIAGSSGCAVGRFFWAYPPDDPNGGYQIAANNGFGVPSGFVMRNLQALNSTYLSNAGNLIQPGFEMAGMTQGDFWVTNDGSTVPIPNYSKAFADLATGKVKFAAPGTVFGGASATGSSIAPASFSVTGVINDDVLTVSAIGSGSVYPGSTISGTGIATGTQIVSQITPLLSGESANGVGRYLLSVGNQSTASVTVTGAYGVLTIGTATGTFAVGDLLTGTNVVAGTAITANLTGSGGSGGTMVVNNATSVSSTTITASTAVETKWVAVSTDQPGNLVKISSWG